MSLKESGIAGIGLGSFRSYFEMQYLAPLGRVTLLAGQNNAGKSNVLRFVRDNLVETPDVPSDLDRPLRMLPKDWEIRLALGVSPPDLSSLGLSGLTSNPNTALGALSRLFNHPFLLSDGLLWFHYVQRNGEREFGGKQRRRWLLESSNIDEIVTSFDGRYDFQSLRQVRNSITGQNWSGGDARTDVSAILAHFAPKFAELPPVRLIEAFREIRPLEDGGEGLGDFNGVGLVQRLEQLERPSHGRREDMQKFERINEFVRSILEDDTALLRIPHDAETVLVERSGDLLPLASLGTGIHQVILLAAAATLLEHHLVCIEEPEVHLHPLLQRRLVRYLAQQTTNDYLIATHSAHLLDFENGQVLHLRHSSAEGTSIEYAGTPHALAAVCADLGYRPSDLLQSNAVIWVEGPSDRIYVRHWIKLLAPSLTEGIHYSIMFYGGGLLSHLTPKDPLGGGLAEDEQDQMIKDFISLRRLNRYLAVVIDSDKKSRGSVINETKRRIQKAFDEDGEPGLAWITKGYTIENYVPRDLLESAVSQVHPRTALKPDGGQWKSPVEMESKSGPDKVAIARRVCENWSFARLDVFDLRRRVQDLVDMIDSANGLSVARAWHAPRR